MLRWSVLAFILSVLAACGGGGSSGDDSDTRPSTSTPPSSDGGGSPPPDEGDGSGTGGETPPDEDRAPIPGGPPAFVPRVVGLMTDQGLIGPGRIVDPTIAFQGTSIAGEVVELYLNGQLAGSSLARSDGSWMLDYSPVPLVPAAYSATVMSVSAVGVETPGPAFDFIYDPSAPPAPVISGVTDDSATALDGITSDNTLLISGTAEANSLLELFLNGLPFATTTVDVNGNWLVDRTLIPFLDGTYTLSAESVYLTLRSATSPLFTLVVDTQAPVAPVISGVTPDTGVSATDAITSSGTLVLSGTAEADAVVRVRLNGVNIGSVTADGSGNWSLNYSSVTLAEGTHAFTALQLDQAGNSSGLSNPFPVQVDTTPPAPVTAISFAPDSGVVGDGVSAANQLIINGTADPGDWVRVSVDGTEIGVVLVDGSGNWGLDHTGTTLAEGAHTISARSSDVAGNLAATALETIVTVDTAVPAAPVVSAVTTDTGTAGDGVTADNTLVINGTAEANTTVTVLLDGISVGTTSANGAGNWAFDYSAVALADNTYTITATATDSSGNVSVASAAFNLRVDTTAPAAPAVTGIASDTGTAGDGITNDNTLVINGTAEANASVTVLIGGVSVGSAAANGAGVWSLDHTGTALADSTYAITATATDGAANTSVASAALNITIDTGIPAAPVVTGITTDSGTAGDGITNDNTLVISGTAEANASVNVLINGASIGTATANGAGDWSYNHAGTALADNTYAITATTTDSAGNTSIASAALNIMVDASVPAAPAVTGISNDSGTTGDGITNDNTLVINGTAEANASVTVLIDGVSIGTAAANGVGTWNFDYTGMTLADNAYAITATATDGSGNTSAVSAALGITLDTTAPTVTTFIPSDDGTGVAHTTNLVLAFDSVVTAQSGNITIRRAADNSIFEQIPAGDARVTGSGTTFIAIDPTANLVGAESYYVQIDAGAFVDAAGNDYAGISDTISWNFTVQDLSLTGSAPADNATGVALNSALMLYFNTPALANAGNITFRLSSDDSVVETIEVNLGQVSGTGSTSVLVSPFVIFEPDTSYYIEIDAGTFESSAGASFAGISGNGTLNFTTANPPVPTVINVTSSTANGTYDVGDTINVQVQFNELVNVTLATPYIMLDLQGVDRAASYVSGSGTTTLNFSYTVKFGDVETDLDYVTTTALNTNGADIRSALFVRANLTLPAPGATGSLGDNRNIAISADGLDLATLTSVDGFQVQGSTGSEHVGWAVQGIGDVNGDGFEDFVTGAPYGSSSAGVAYIVYGQAGATRSNVNTAAISNGTNGFRITGQSGTDYLGSSVGGAGDINDDGYDDIYVIAPRDDDYNTDAGILYVIYGKASHTDVAISGFNSSIGFRVTTSELSAAMGDSITGYTGNGQAIDAGGDFNGDGVQDLVLGLRVSDRNGVDSGMAYVIFGRAGSTRDDVNLDLINPTGTNGVLIYGASAGWQLGQAARFVGDYDVDGLDDIAVSAIYADATGTDAGQTYLIFGSHGPVFNAVDVAALNGVNGFKVNSSNNFGVLGHSVAGGDFNGDGISDLFVSQNGYNTNTGAGYVIYGDDSGGVYADVDVDTMLGSTGYGIFGETLGEYLGHSLANAGDFNADGLDDLLIASYLRDDGGADSGAAWLVSGYHGTARADLSIANLNPADGFKISGGGIGDHFGQSTTAADVNGDGFSDMIVGTPWGDNASIDGGETVVLWGREFASPIVAGLIGSAGDDNLAGTSGNDTLVSNGGSDAISAGAGNDTIQVGNTGFYRIDGGEGTDTLQFVTSLNNLDLSTMGPETIRGIEVIDLGDSGNGLRVTKEGVQALSRESRVLFVRGGSSDTVTSTLGDAWCYTGTRVVDSVTYHTYLDNGAILYIQNGIDHSGVGGFNVTQQYTFNTTSAGANVSGAVTNFPVLIRVSNTIRDSMQANRADIRFTDRDQITWLPYEIEIGASNELYVWVLVPQVDGNSNSDYIVMHYNDRVNGSVPDRQNPPAVWFEYAGVWHFDEASGNALDSTAYQNHGVQSGTVSRESSLIGRGVRFDSGTERFTVSYDASFNVSGRNFTVELWLDGTGNCTTDPFFIKDYMTGVSRGEGSSRFWRIMTGGAFPIWAGGFVGSPGAQIGDTGGTDQLNAPGWISSDCANHMVLDHNQTYGSRLYINGSLSFSDGSVRNIENLQDLIIGNTGGVSDARIDEVRVTSRSLSANRIRLSSVNQRSTLLVSP